MFEITPGGIYQTIITPGGSIIVKHYSLEKVVSLTTNKQAIESDGIDKVIITAQWQKFNVENGEHETDPVNVNPIIFNTPQGQITDQDGVLEFTSLEPGEYEFSAVYGLNSVKVVVS